ncbi:MAG: hypothetical protein JJ863_22205 [Deltaproteobacteria bacterium]|nr:hypothetical protein [Deltaproteobacteria bacterium]
MAFRDDNEALRARTKAAEKRAAEAEGERERMQRELAEAKSNDAADAKRIKELEKRLAKLEPKPPKSPSAAPARFAVFAALALVLMGGIAGYMMMMPVESKDPAMPMPAAQAVEAPAPAPVPPPPAPEPAGPLERVRLAGVVRSADGVEGLDVGAGCIADLGVEEGFSKLQVRCGAGDRVVTIYGGVEANPAGIVQTSGGVEEAITVPGYVSRSMSYARTGQWSGPTPQIQIDPDQHAARIWLQGIEARDVLLHLQFSDFGVGERAAAQDAQGTVALGTLAKLVVRGEVPGALGDLDTDDCVFRSEPVPRSGPGALTARFVASCGDRILYGAGRSGWIPAPADGQVAGPVEDTQMSAADTDPMMTYTGDSLTLVEPEWRIVFDLEPHPACTLTDGHWVGAIRDETGELRTGVTLTDGELTLPDGSVLMGTEDMRCHEGVARWTTEDGTTMLDGHFGPSFATWVGRLGTGPLIELYRN